jgi:hypothetical protein
MEDRLHHTWKDHVKKGESMWRLKRRFWKTYYSILKWLDWWPPPEDSPNPYKEKPP